ncbi:MAG: lycopene cyclase family protein [Deltaproteobacteria bacterium]|nr:MAG: lycopene cyclase family protein [Deltaproteobacteria bacterium]
MSTDLRQKPESIEVLLVGAGPAGLRLAAELTSRGVGVCIVDPSPDQFEASFGLFAEDLPEDLAPAVCGQWDHVRFATSAGTRAVHREYLRLNSRILHRLLQTACEGCAWVRARVTSVTQQGKAFEVVLDTGDRLVARRVVDCSGHRRVLGRADARHAQVALGATLHGDHGMKTPLFMDFSGPQDGTFLYALPVSANELFVEETALITDRAPAWSLLEQRLRARLASLGLTGEIEVHEHCVIPMDSALPDLDSPVLAFGAAAGMVHPATGYQLAASLALAGPFAARLAETLDDPVETAARACWDVLWSDEARRVRELRLFGARFVAGLPHADQAAFFDAFFQLPADLARTYLAHDGGLADTCRAMLRMFALLPTRLRWWLVLAGISQPVTLLRPLLTSRSIAARAGAAAPASVNPSRSASGAGNRLGVAPAGTGAALAPKAS